MPVSVSRRKVPLIPNFLPILTIALAPCLIAWQPAASQNALVKQYCVSCHNDKLKTASVSLEGLDIAKAGEDPAVWEKVLRKVGSNQMPPAGVPHPDPAAAKAFTTALRAELDRYAAAHPDPGHPVIHRLNRAEYSNAIRDIFALDIEPGSKLPADDSGYGFDNIGDVLSLSPILIERYMTVGRMVSRLAVGDPDVKPAVDVFATTRERVAPRPGGRGPRNERISDDVPFDSAGGLSFQYTFPLDAEYVFKVQAGGPARPGRGLQSRLGLGGLAVVQERRGEGQGKARPVGDPRGRGSKGGPPAVRDRKELPVKRNRSRRHAKLLGPLGRGKCERGVAWRFRRRRGAQGNRRIERVLRPQRCGGERQHHE